MKRKIIQISCIEGNEISHNQGALVLCDDGSFWYFDLYNEKWSELKNVPQDEEKE